MTWYLESMLLENWKVRPLKERKKVLLSSVYSVAWLVWRGAVGVAW